MSVSNSSGAGARSTEQVFGTPTEFILAVQRKYGPISFDLAASEEAHVHPQYYTEQDDSLDPQTIWPDTPPGCWNWLNPPFSKIAPWMERSKKDAGKGKQIMALVPASVGSKWFSYYVDGAARVKFLRPRSTFIGHTQSFPKDLMLCLFTPAYVTGFIAQKCECVDWREW